MIQTRLRFRGQGRVREPVTCRADRKTSLTLRPRTHLSIRRPRYVAGPGRIHFEVMRSLQGGGGNRGFSEASSSRQTTTCHWIVIGLCPTWNPRSSTLKSPSTVLVLPASSTSRSLSESKLRARRAASIKSWHPERVGIRHTHWRLNRGSPVENSLTQRQTPGFLGSFGRPASQAIATIHELSLLTEPLIVVGQ